MYYKFITIKANMFIFCLPEHQLLGENNSFVWFTYFLGLVHKEH